jgi:queuosine precursor transporter
MLQLSFDQWTKLSIALAIYIVSIIAANTLGLKLMPFIFGTNLSVSVFSMPIIFLMTDVIGEVYGKKVARTFVLAGFVSIALFITYSLLSLSMPWSAKAEWVHAGYDQVFGTTIRIAIASLLAFAIAEYQDVFTFFFFKNLWKEKLFWLRSLLSNLWSQLLDTVIFMVVAFAGIYPTATLINIIISWWLFKVCMGFFYTPLSYLGIYLLKKDYGTVKKAD